jgi:transcriptional regulator with XRE-family HTH domain
VTDLRFGVRQNISAELRRRGLKQSDLAYALGVSVQSISAKLRGRRPLRIEEIEKIASRLDVNVAYLLGRSDADPGGAAVDVSEFLPVRAPEGYNLGADGRVVPVERKRIVLQRRLGRVLPGKLAGKTDGEIAAGEGVARSTISEDVRWLISVGRLPGRDQVASVAGVVPVSGAVDLFSSVGGQAGVAE